jgi:hypothetical protein
MIRLILILLAASVLLAGCNIVDSASGEEFSKSATQRFVGSSTPASSLPCTKYIEWPHLVVDADSGASCPFSDSGSYPAFPIRATWTGSCKVTSWRDIDGGIYGVRYSYGCLRKAPNRSFKDSTL